MLANDFGDANFDDLELIDRVCDEFESNWKAERNPEISEYLSRLHESYQRTLFKELVRTDVFYRKKQGKLLTFSEYATTWPDLLDALYELESELQFENFPVVPDYFKLGDLIGEGSFGFVHKARDTRHDRWVAIKTPRHRVLSAEERKQYLHEIKTVASLDHPNVVKIYESGESTTGPYVVYEFVNGRSLAELTSRQKFSVQEASEIVLQILEILEYVHQQGVLHRDLKPANLILDAGSVKLIDFGLAKRCGNESTLNSGHKFLGTFAYASPEQISGETKELQPASDLYSVGVIFYQLLSGTKPNEWVNDRKRRLAGFSLPAGKGFSARFRRIIAKATALNPQERFQNANEMSIAIRDALNWNSAVLDPLQFSDGILRNWWWHIPVFAAAALFGAVIFFPPNKSVAPPELRDVIIATEPIAAKICFFPLDQNGEPILDKERTFETTSNQKVQIFSRDYLVVATPLDPDGQYTFHEVYRHVPSASDWSIGNSQYPHLRAEHLPNGLIELPAITLPKKSVTDGMADFVSVPRETPGDPAKGISLQPEEGFYVDFMEATNQQVQDTWPDLAISMRTIAKEEGRWNLENAVSISNWHDAVAYAEAHGKRLPTFQEYELLATARKTQNYPWGNEWPAEAVWQVGPPGAFNYDKLTLDPRIQGLLSNVGEWTVTTGNSQAERLVAGAPAKFVRNGILSQVKIPANTGTSTDALAWRCKAVGFRCYRSKEARRPIPPAPQLPTGTYFPKKL